MTRPSLGSIIRQSTQQLISGGIKMALEENREQILQFLKTAESDRGAALLYDICNRVPAAAGIITMLMNGTPEQAVISIAHFDPDMAEQIQSNMSNFRRLQEAWARGKQP
jgi:hypothetical protein